MSAQGIDGDQHFLSKVERSSRRNRTTKDHKATHTPPPILLPSPIGHDDSSLLCLGRVPSEMGIEDHLPAAGFLVDSRGSVEDVCPKVWVLLLDGVVSIEEVDGAAGDGVVKLVADLGR